MDQLPQQQQRQQQLLQQQQQQPQRQNQRQEQQQAQENNKQPPELRYECVDSAQRPQEQRAQLEQNYHHLNQQHQDVRMKRHPELQPYVPSDRYTTSSSSAATFTSSSLATTSTAATSTTCRSTGARAPIRDKHGNKFTTASSSMTNNPCGNLSTGQPKKYCSMTRLNQLAQPKTRPTNSSSSQKPAAAATNGALGSAKRTKPHKQPQSRPQQPRQQQHPPTPTPAVGPNTTNTPVVVPETMQTPVAASKTSPQTSTPVVPLAQSKVNISTPAVQPPTPASSLEEELGLATATAISSPTATPVSARGLNATRDIVHETSSLADQVAEISVNDCFYQSAASDLVPDSESTKNGSINYDRNPDSLCREFEQDLIAKGIVSDHETSGNNYSFADFASPKGNSGVVNGSRNSNNESTHRTSAATIVTSEHSQTERALQAEQEDDDNRRMKAERELREKARLEEEERKQRELLVENIMSRFSQGSVS